MTIFRSGFISVVAATVTLQSAPATAYDAYGEARVLAVEVTYMPRSLNFFLSANIGSCKAGTPITWLPQGDTEASKIANAQAVLATILTARTSGQSVRVYLSNAGCNAEYLYIL
jgi:hypothetical protein